MRNLALKIAMSAQKSIIDNDPLEVFVGKIEELLKEHRLDENVVKTGLVLDEKGEAVSQLPKALITFDC